MCIRDSSCTGRQEPKNVDGFRFFGGYLSEKVLAKQTFALRFDLSENWFMYEEAYIIRNRLRLG